MKKILILLFALISFVAMGQIPANIYVETVTVSESITVSGDTVLTQGDTISIPSAVSSASNAGGGDAIFSNYMSSFAHLESTATLSSVPNSNGFISMCINQSDTVISSVRIKVQTASGTPTYSNFNGVVVYSVDGDVLTKIGESANDGTIFNTVGLIDIPLIAEAEVEKGVVAIEIVVSMSAGTRPSLIGLNAAIDNDWYNIGYDTSYKRNPATDAPSTITLGAGGVGATGTILFVIGVN